MAATAGDGQRALPGTQRTVSEIGIAVDPGPVASPTIDRQWVGALRRARREGVNLFDIAGARSPDRAEGLLRAAFPERGADLVVIVAYAPESSPGTTEPGGPASFPGTTEPPSFRTVERWLSESRSHLPPEASIVPEASLATDDPKDSRAVLTALASIASQPAVVAWSARMRRDRLLRSSWPSEPLLPIASTELSLLDARAFPRPPRAGAHPAPRLLVRDPFAGGLLDGSRLGTGLGDRRPGRAPPDVRELRDEFAPVLRLGFLTERRSRTLAQAALSYLLQRPDVLSVLIPPPAPERWEEVLGARKTPPLSPEEIARLER